MKPSKAIKSIIAKIKKDSGFKSAINPPVKRMETPGRRERDMRQEAMDIGSHNAHEYFGGQDK